MDQFYKNPLFIVGMFFFALGMIGGCFLSVSAIMVLGSIAIILSAGLLWLANNDSYFGSALIILCLALCPMLTVLAMWLTAGVLGTVRVIMAMV